MVNKTQDEKNSNWIAEYIDDSAIVASGFDSSIIGYTTDSGCTRVVYDTESMAQTLVDDGLTHEEAWEYLEFNTFCAYVGEGTPIYMNRINEYH